MGDYEAADAHLLEALRLGRAALGESHPVIGGMLVNLAVSHHIRGELDRAGALYDEAIPLMREAYGAEHPEVAAVTGNLAELRAMQGDLERARELHARTLAILEKTQGPDSVQASASRANLAGVHYRLGELEASRAGYQQALDSVTATLGEDAPKAAYAHLGLARIARDQGRTAQAVTHARRAVEVRSSEAVPVEQRGLAHFELALSLEGHGDLDGARAEAERAQQAYREAGGVASDDAAQVDEWLAAHAGTSVSAAP